MSGGPALNPPPRRLQRLDGALPLAAVTLGPADGNPAFQPAADRLARSLVEAGVAVRRAADGSGAGTDGVALRLHLDPDPVDAREGYRLEATPTGIEIAAGAEAGLYYGAETLLQWLAIHSPPAAGGPRALPAVRIEDRPGFRHRGLLLDVSRNRVPTMASLHELVDRLAALKLNQLQLYTEHTFAYRGHEVVWRDASPLTAGEVRALDAHCRSRCMELVPNQNSFGHLHRWLRHDAYRHLAEVPEGLPHPFGSEAEPFSLCPTDPGAIELLGDLYGQLLPQFTSRQLNVGCDETFDLGRGRSAAACRERGRGRVYLDFVRRIHALAAGHGRRIQLWGDMLASHPELVAELPRDVIVLEWGYEAGHPFAERAAALAAAGLEFYLCPGTSGWNSFAGRLDNALANLAEAARAGVEHGAAGYLITDWGDWGHLQPPPVSWPALTAGAALAWNPGAAEDAMPGLDELVDRHWRLAPGTGRALAGLGNAYREAGVLPVNASALFKLVIFCDRSLAESGLGELTQEGLDRAAAAVAAAREQLSTLAPADDSQVLAQRELRWVAGMLELACRLGVRRLEAGGEHPLGELPRAARRDLARRLGNHIEELRPLWLARSRPGGLAASRRHLERVRELLR